MGNSKFKVVQTDIDKTFIDTFGISILIKHNKANPKQALERILSNGLMKPEQFEFYLSKMKLKISDVEKELPLISKVGVYGLYNCENKSLKLSIDNAIEIMNELLVGINEGQVKEAAKEAVEYIREWGKDWIEYASVFSEHNILLSDGWHPIVEAIALHLNRNGKDLVEYWEGNKPIFADGIYKGDIKQRNKLNTTIELYEKWKVPRNADGIFQDVLIVDDSAFNIPLFKIHQYKIAFSPTKTDRKELRDTYILVAEDFQEVKRFSEALLFFSDKKAYKWL